MFDDVLTPLTVDEHELFSVSNYSAEKSTRAARRVVPALASTPASDTKLAVRSPPERGSSSSAATSSSKTAVYAPAMVQAPSATVSSSPIVSREQAPAPRGRGKGRVQGGVFGFDDSPGIMSVGVSCPHSLQLTSRLASF